MLKRYNLIIDGQNVPVQYVPGIMDYCTATGFEQHRARLYASTSEIGDIMASDATRLADYDVDPVPVRCRRGKNSVDIMIAVDIIEEACDDPAFEVVIVATNDSDFTHVASRVISYKMEFHLLYTGAKPPAGYSQKVGMSRLTPVASRRRKIVAKVKSVAASLAGKPAPKDEAAPATFEPDPAYSHSIPLHRLSAAGWISRILSSSPVAIDSRSLFSSWKDFTGRAWKGKGSKKSPQQFFAQNFPGIGYRFIEWDALPQHQGYFLSEAYDSLESNAGWRNPVLSLMGVEPELAERQCAVLADALRSAAHQDFNVLYDSCADTNVLPRYGAWAILSCWLAGRAAVGAAPGWKDPIGRDPAADPQALRDAFNAELRRQFEAGELALATRDASGPN